MGSDDVLVGPTTKRGVRVLRDYLRYVESRRLEVGDITGRDFDSDFEREVRSRLVERDFVVDPQVGVAGYRIDLGVRHPNRPSIYLAGVECDGAAFHSARSARDRDRLRESVLRGKGWNIVRVWSTDWFANPDLQTDRLVAELQRLAAKPIISESFWTITAEPSASSVKASDLDEAQKSQAIFTTAPVAPDLAFAPNTTDPSNVTQQLENGQLTETEVKNTLRLLRDQEISKEFPELDPERCILRDMMINRIIEARLDEPEDFTGKIPLWLRERTDQRQLKYLERVCALVRQLQ
jgi:very-short-patch-repair endonuclease